MLSSALSLVTFVGLSSALAIKASEDVGYYYMPIEFDIGADNRATAQLMFGSNDTEPITIVMDTGSADFWIWSPNATFHWGSNYLGVIGPCNTTVPTPYNPLLSTTSISHDQESAYAYAGNAKIVSGTQYINDSLTFSSSSSSSTTFTTIPNIQFALENKGIFRQLDNGSCIVPAYDKGILGLSPYTNTTTGPAFRQNLFDAGSIATKTMTMWFDASTSAVQKLTGGILFSAIDTSKLSGPLIQLPNAIEDNQVGVYVAKPNLTFAGQASFALDEDTNCLVDSGAHADTLPFDFSSDLLDTFVNSTNGQLLQYAGGLVFNGTCGSIPDVNMTYTFAGLEAGKTMSIDVPLRNYARGAETPSYSGLSGVCFLNIDTGGCIFGAPFLSGAVMGLDDGDGSIWFGKGGVSVAASGVKARNLKLFGVGEGFESL